MRSTNTHVHVSHCERTSGFEFVKGCAASRLPVGTVQRIERLVGGDPVSEARILRFIAARYGAKNLFFYLLLHIPDNLVYI